MDKIAWNHEFWHRLLKRSSHYEQQQQKKKFLLSYLGRSGNFLRPPNEINLHQGCYYTTKLKSLHRLTSRSITTKLFAKRLANERNWKKGPHFCGKLKQFANICINPGCVQYVMANQQLDAGVSRSIVSWYYGNGLNEFTNRLHTSRNRCQQRICWFRGAV